jgi:hypothetical protein
MFRDRLAGKVYMIAFRDSDLETTASQDNSLPNKDKPSKNQGQGCGKRSRYSPTGLSRME